MPPMFQFHRAACVQGQSLRLRSQVDKVYIDPENIALVMRSCQLQIASRDYLRYLRCLRFFPSFPKAICCSRLVHGNA